MQKKSSRKFLPIWRFFLLPDVSLITPFANRSYDEFCLTIDIVLYLLKFQIEKEAFEEAEKIKKAQEEEVIVYFPL